MDSVIPMLCWLKNRKSTHGGFMGNVIPIIWLVWPRQWRIIFFQAPYSILFQSHKKLVKPPFWPVGNPCHSSGVSQNWTTRPGQRLQFAIENGPFIVDIPKDGDFP